MKTFNYLQSLINEETSRIEVLKYIELKNDMFDKILDSGLTNIEIIYFSSNLSLNKNNINKLFDLEMENANINLLRNDNCPEERLDEFIALKDKIYNIAIAHNRSLSKINIEKLLKLNDTDVNISLQFNNLL